MIRPTRPEDSPALIAASEGTQVFSGHDIQALREVLDDYHATNYDTEGHRSITLEQDGRPIGFAYYAPASMTDRTWYLWWIVVSKHVQAKGLGGRLLHAVEDAIRAEKGRLLLLETSSLPEYELTRKFYVKHKYFVAAQLKDYYADGNDMVIFGKRLTV